MSDNLTNTLCRIDQSIRELNGDDASYKQAQNCNAALEKINSSIKDINVNKGSVKFTGTVSNLSSGSSVLTTDMTFSDIEEAISKGYDVSLEVTYTLPSPNDIYYMRLTLYNPGVEAVFSGYNLTNNDGVMYIYAKITRNLRTIVTKELR